MYEEIFDKEIFKFQTNSEIPYIIDGGANIGLSTIYFKKIYPNSEIISFEPDKKIVEAFKKNIASFGFKNVTLIEKGLWNTETTVSFFSEGAESGRIDNAGKIKVETSRLSSYLNKKVDFLKLDIEGAETIVLEDCKDLLVNVKNLFVEYHSFSNTSQSLEDILRILTSSGFRYYIKPVNENSNNPFIKINPYLNMDLQLNIFAYR